MALFGSADENALKAKQQELDKLEAQLNRLKLQLETDRALDTQARANLQAEITKFASDQQSAYEVLRKAKEDLSSSERDLHEREQRFLHQEIEAKNGFVQKQREVFQEAIGHQIASLHARKLQLDALEEDLGTRLKRIVADEGEFAARQLALKERELQADAGFASKTLKLLDDVKRQEEYVKQLLAQQESREKELLEGQRMQAESAELLRRRAEEIRKAEVNRDSGFVEERKRLDEELHNKRIIHYESLAAEHQSKTDEMQRGLSATRAAQTEALRSELDELRRKSEAELEMRRSDFERTLSEAKQKLDNERKGLDADRAKLVGEQQQLEFDRKLLTARNSACDQRESRLNDLADQAVADRHRSFGQREQALQDECQRLRNQLKGLDSVISGYEELKTQLGESPEAALLRLNQHVEQIAKLREELNDRPTAEMRQVFEENRLEVDRLKRKIEESQLELNGHRDRAAGENELRAQLSSLDTTNRSLASQNESLARECARLQDEQKRLQAAYARTAERDQLIRDVESPHFKETPVIGKAINFEGAESEIKWLDSISQQCIEYGLRFPRRILHAFHTSLKTAEWSPLTVLAGVSGTGKSELPRLYSHFGGIKFLPLAVQPNWDSQESMLGFFNSIDNKFDSQPVLRFLAQSQKAATEDYPGLQDAVCMVLLDEMNLAYMELYFSDFLSKLEYRRGLKGSDTPTLEVKLGAGLEPYHLPLGRNVLWTGTMNQDETTKSLSDKVLDRSIVIHFPRPIKLERRQKLNSLSNPAQLLPRKAWEKWWSRDTDFTEEQIAPFKDFIEGMNESLSNVGRALGHRVWQSIEYYMANYPDVRVAKEGDDSAGIKRAMRMAFEDQLVQKVMPKLRGIDTRGESKANCLDLIRRTLDKEEYSIVQDFDLACKLGYGQFMWQTANYLSEDATHDAVAPALEQTATESQAIEIPEAFMRGGNQQLRQEKWNALKPREKRSWLPRGSSE